MRSSDPRFFVALFVSVVACAAGFPGHPLAAPTTPVQAAATTTSSVRWVVDEAGGGSVTTGGLYTAPTAAGTYHVRAVSVVDGTVSAAATVTVGTAPPVTSVIATLDSLPDGLNWTGNGGAWDAMPGAAAGQWMAAQASGSTIGVGWGQIGSTPSGVTFDQGGGEYHTSACQDSSNYDLHVVSDRYGAEMGYRRFHPTRDGNGVITGFTQTAGFIVPQLAGGSGNSVTIWEVIDGAGNHRLLAMRATDATPTAPDAVDIWAVQTTVAAGVSPTQASDWVALDNTTGQTHVGQIPASTTDSNAYDTQTEVGQHKTSRKVELFFSQCFHGVAGNHAFLTLTPSGTAWTGASGGAISVYDSSGGAGSAAVALNDDTVWWAWYDSSGLRISKIDSAGTVTNDPIPRPGPLSGWNAGRVWTVSGDGTTAAIIDIQTDVDTPVVQGRIYAAGAWGAWTPLGNLPYHNYFHARLQGTGTALGTSWLGGFVTTNATSEGSSFVALGF